MDRIVYAVLIVRRAAGGRAADQRHGSLWPGGFRASAGHDAGADEKTCDKMLCFNIHIIFNDVFDF